MLDLFGVMDLAETHSPVIELSQLLITSANGASLPASEGSIAGRERVSEYSKKCENGSKVMEENNVTEEKRDVEKKVESDGSFFECRICLDLSNNPVVTNCGHLYCWSCLYHWLQASEAKECPVCRGTVSEETVTPIYGRGEQKRKSEEVSNTKIPWRPHARRVESLRKTLYRTDYIPTEMIRHLQNRRERESSTGERDARPFLNQFITSRGVRAEQNQSNEVLVAPSDDVNNVDLSSNIFPEHEGENENPRFSHALSIQRQLAQMPESMSSFTLSSSESLVDDYLITDALGRNQEQNINPHVGVEDRDSFSSIVGIINSESQVDTETEIDSMLNISPSSSVRRHENGSRVNDVNSEDSRPLSRRRLA